MPLKICFLALNAYPTLSGHSEARVGGAEVQQKMIAEYLADQGYGVSMITRDHGQPNRQLINGVKVLKTFSFHDGIRYLRFIHPRLTSVWKALKRADADIYYQRCAGMETGVLALFCKLHGKRFIFASGSDSDFDMRTMIIPSRRDRMLYLYGLKRASAVVTQTLTQRNLLLKNFGIESEIIPNCWKSTSKESLSQAGYDGFVLWISTLRGWKRPGLFLDLAERLPRYRFVMAGGPASGESGLYEAIRERAELLPNVSFHGFVPFAEVDKLFDGASLVVNTSEPKEGFPNTFLQAWQRSIPVVSYFDPGGIISERELGAKVADVDAMVTAVTRLLGDLNQYRRLCGNAGRYFEENHGIDQLGPCYEVLFRRLTGT